MYMKAAQLKLQGHPALNQLDSCIMYLQVAQSEQVIRTYFDHSMKLIYHNTITDYNRLIIDLLENNKGISNQYQYAFIRQIHFIHST